MRSLLVFLLIFSALTRLVLAADIANGKKLYQQTCVACHGTNGRSLISGVPDFSASNSRLKKKDKVLMRHMLKGFRSKGSMMAMPPKGGNAKLTKKDLADILEYMRKDFLKK